MSTPARLGALALSLVLALGGLVAAPAVLAVPAPSAAQSVVVDHHFAAADAAAPVTAILTFDHQPTAAEVARVQAAGLKTHTFSTLPMVAVLGSKAAVQGLSSMAGLRSIYLNRPLDFYLDDSVKAIGADRVWKEMGITGKGVGVAVLDSGVDATHPDLTLGSVTVQNVKLLPSNFFTGEPVYLENQPNTDTSSGHGTHVAGTIAGRGTASAGRYTGVAPGAHLVGLGAGEGLHILWALQGFDYAIANRDRYNIKVISNSWGTSGKFVEADPVNVASRTAYEKGMTVVFAAGNAGPGENTLNPYSVAPWVIGVAAGCTTDRGVRDTTVRCPVGSRLANFSSRGIPGDPLYHPTITAPGVWIAAARATTGTAINAATADENVFCGIADPVLYTCANGTSMATPHISGVAALLLEAKPGLHPDLVKEAMVATATPMTRPDGSLYEEWEVGAGYVDAFAAVQKAQRMKAQPSRSERGGKTVATYTETYTWSGTVTPGVAEAGAASHDFHDQDILADAVSATVRIQWTDPVQDLDLYVYAPDGSLIGKSAQGVTAFEETTFFGNTLLPKGTYRVDTEGWLAVVAPYNGSFSVEYVVGGKTSRKQQASSAPSSGGAAGTTASTVQSTTATVTGAASSVTTSVTQSVQQVVEQVQTTAPTTTTPSAPTVRVP